MTTPSVSVLPTATTASATSSSVAAPASNGRGTGAALAPTGKGHVAFADMLQRRHHVQADTDDLRVESRTRGRHEPLDEAATESDAELTPAMALALLQQDDRFVAARLPGGTDTAADEAAERSTSLAGIAGTRDARVAVPDGEDADASIALPGAAGRTATADLSRAESGIARGAPVNELDTVVHANDTARESATALRDGAIAASSRTAANETVAGPASDTKSLQTAAAALSTPAGTRDTAAPVAVAGEAVAARVLAAVEPTVTGTLPGSRAGAAISPRTLAARSDTSLRGESANIADRDLRSTGMQPALDGRRDTQILVTPVPLAPVATETASTNPFTPQPVDNQAASVAMGLPTTSNAAGPATAQVPTPGATPLPPALVAPTVGSPLWAGAFSHQMVAISQRAGSATQTAELHLNPPDLGPLRVLLSMKGDQAQAIFVSAHGAVRSAVEAALPQLQQSLADAGIHLGQASVGEQAPQEQDNNTGRGQRRGDTLADAGADTAEVPTAPARATQGLIDAYA